MTILLSILRDQKIFHLVFKYLEISLKHICDNAFIALAQWKVFYSCKKTTIQLHVKRQLFSILKQKN